MNPAFPIFSLILGFIESDLFIDLPNLYYFEIAETSGLKDTTQVENLQDQVLFLIQITYFSKNKCWGFFLLFFIGLGHAKKPH